MPRIFHTLRRSARILSWSLAVMAWHPTPVNAGLRGVTSAVVETQVPVTPGAVTPGAVTPGAVTPGAITPGSAADATPTASPRGFTLQVATFADRGKADELASRIDGAWIQEVRKGSDTLYRVNYRRFDERTAAVRAQWDLEDLGYKSFIQQLFA